LMLERLDVTSFLAVSLSSVVELIEDHVDFAITNGAC
jgi:hypothetical protein